MPRQVTATTPRQHPTSDSQVPGLQTVTACPYDLYREKLNASFHFNTLPCPIVFENNRDRFDNKLIWVRLAVLNDLMLGNPALSEVKIMLLCEAVIPAAVPRRQRVGIFLVGISQLVEGEFLKVKKTVRIDLET